MFLIIIAYLVMTGVTKMLNFTPHLPGSSVPAMGHPFQQGGVQDWTTAERLEEEEALKWCGCIHHTMGVWTSYGCMKHVWYGLVCPPIPSLPPCCSLPELHCLVESILENTVLNIMNEATCGELDFRRPLKTLAVAAQSTKLPTV